MSIAATLVALVSSSSGTLAQAIFEASSDVIPDMGQTRAANLLADLRSGVSERIDAALAALPTIGDGDAVEVLSVAFEEDLTFEQK